MLNYFSMGPTSDGFFLVAYKTPGCESLTIACICKTLIQSEEEVTRLNEGQLNGLV